MTLNFPEARDAATEKLRPEWGDRQGTFYVAPWGYQDAEGYLVIVGAQEFIEGGDMAYLVPDDQVTYVSPGGVVSTSSYMTNRERIDRMKPVGTLPPELREQLPTP